MPKTYLISLVILILILIAAGAAGFFIWRNLPVRQASNLAVPPPSAEVGVDGPQTPSVEEGGGELEILANQALDRKIPAGDAAKTKELKDLSLQLKSEPNYLQGWLQLGILRKFLEDYEGASLAWQYASAIRPADYVAFNNLGDLYHFYLKDFAKAEKYIKQAISVKPDFIPGYKNLFDLYALSYTEKSSQAVPILLEGIQKNQSDYYLKVVLASYYKDQGDKPNARKYYEEALKLNPPNKAAIEEELNNI